MNGRLFLNNVSLGIIRRAVALDFEILPAALRVRISARHPGVSPSGLLP